MSFISNHFVHALAQYSTASSSSSHSPSGTPQKTAAAAAAAGTALPSISPTSVAGTNSNTIKQRKPDVRYEDLSSDSIFKLLENLQWKEVVRRLQAMSSSPSSPSSPSPSSPSSPSSSSLSMECPPQSDETNTWVSKSDRRGMKLMFRRLPIHEACVRKATPEVMLQLLTVNASCASERDNSSRTPLHHAFIHEVDMDVIYLLFNTYREAVDVPDFWGKTPREYAMLNKSPFKKRIMQMFNQSNEEIASIVKTIEADLVKKSFLMKQVHGISSIKSQPNATELFLEEELEQARVESDIAYVQRDAAFMAQERLSEKVKELEQQLQQKNERLQEMDDISRRNKSLNSLLTKFENQNKQLEHTVAEQVKTIQLAKEEAKSLTQKLEGEMKEKERKLNETISEYQRSHEKMKETITCLSDKLRRMDSNLDDTISVLENDLDWEGEEKINTSVEQKVKYLEELVDLYKGNLADAKTKFEECNKERIALESSVREISKESKGVLTENGSLKLCLEKVAIAEIERDEYQREAEIYKKCLDSSRERVTSLEELINAHENRTNQLEDELHITKDSYLFVMDQLIERDETIEMLEENLDQFSTECDLMRDSFHHMSARERFVGRSDMVNCRSMNTRSRSRSSNLNGRRRTRSISPFVRR